MFRLILDHPYTHVAEAIDVSGANNHGLARDVSLLPNGAFPGSGALNFAQPSSRVSLGYKPTFKHLHALKIETTVRVQSLGQRRNLVEGDNSFAFFIHPNGVLAGTALGRVSAGGPLGWYGADSYLNSPSGGTTVPMNRWVRLAYIHDGFAAIRLYIDGNLVAINSNLSSSIRPVGSRGIHIGNWPAGDAYTFHGAIDGVRIWKWEPDAAYHQFFCRKVCKCWDSIFGGLGTWSAGPDGRRRLESILRCIGTIQAEIIRGVRRQDEKTLRKNADLSRRYREIWCRGKIGGDEMRDLLKEWLDLIERSLGRERLAELVQAMTACFDKQGVMHAIPDRIDFNNCDPDFVSFIQNLMGLIPHLGK